MKNNLLLLLVFFIIISVINFSAFADQEAKDVSPEIPSDPIPADLSTNVSLYPDLSWLSNYANTYSLKYWSDDIVVHDYFTYQPVSLDDPVSVFSADIDGDGDMDVLTASSNDNKISWFENNGLQNPSFTAHLITADVVGARCVYAADLDGDNDMDVIAGSIDDNKIEWYENDGAEMPSFITHVLSTTANGINSICAEDIDNDEDMDILAATTYNNRITWYENDGAELPTFTPIIIASDAEYIKSVSTADVDGDNDIDVLSASANDDEISWYENDGAIDPTFTLHVVSNKVYGAFCVKAADIDKDGDTDIVSASNYDDKITWYENDGTTSPTFTKHDITNEAMGAYSICLADVDGDDDIDVISASSDDNKIAWYENSGAADPSFSPHVLTTNASGARAVFASDINGDSHIDILSASYGDDKVAWYKNNGNSNPTFSIIPIVSEAYGADCVYAADIDNDGNMDIVSSSLNDDRVAWYKNNGENPPAFTMNVINNNAYGARSVYTADIDGDGDTDILSAALYDDTIAWYENDGSAYPSFITHEIITNAYGARSVFAADIDDDGDVDVLSASSYDNRIMWFENDGSPFPYFYSHIISTTAYTAKAVFAADMDNDNDMDVLSASAYDDKISWYENDGNTFPTFTEHVITTQADSANSLYAIDINGDGFKDVLSGSSNDNELAWYENSRATTPTFTAHVITAQATGVSSVASSDIDRDGDNDVLYTSNGSKRIVWYENGGSLNPNFTEHVISTSIDDPYSVCAFDIDNDNDMDVVSASYGDDKISWFENVTHPIVTEITGITENQYLINSELRVATQYHWQITAENETYQIEGPIWTFTTGGLSDIENWMLY